MSRRLVVSLSLAALFVPVMGTPALGVESFVARVTLVPGLPTPVTVDDPASARVEFPTAFASIERLCIFITFETDLLDPGETIMFTFPENVGGTGSQPLTSRGAARRRVWRQGFTTRSSTCSWTARTPPRSRCFLPVR
jgi:hypothetical protein